MAADQGGGVEPPANISTKKILETIASLLATKDKDYIEHVKKRAREHKFKFKGLEISEDMVVEALSGASTEEASNGAATGPATGTTGPAGQRWVPSEASPAALAAKALAECEEAEPYNERVRVVGNQKVQVLPKPDNSLLPTGDALEANQWAETCARVVNRKDGRVYVRLRHINGWISSRSRKDFSKVVLEVESGKELEPASTQVIGRSRVARLMPLMNQEGHLLIERKEAFAARRFRTTIQVQILPSPDSTGAAAKLNAKEEFLADGAYVKAADGRAYLHLKDGKGWICERAKADFSKLAVEPCGTAEDFLEEEDEAVAPAVRTREAGKKVIMLEKSEALGNDAEEPGAKGAAEDGSAVFRSDAELWPEELKPKAIKKSLRLQLRRLYLLHGQKVKDCNEDLKEVTDRAATFGRACPAQKELLQYAEALRKEADKAKKAWSDAVKALLRENPLEDQPAPTVAGSGVSPVQVRGGRWYCAMLQHTEESGGVTRQCGPLRMSHQDAAADLQRLQEAKDENLKRKSEAPQEAEPASKKGKTKD